MFKARDEVVYKPTMDKFFVTRTPREYEFLFIGDQMYYTIETQHQSWIIPKSEMENGQFVKAEDV